MRAKDFIKEENFGTTPPRPQRPGARPPRSATATPRYKTVDDSIEEHKKNRKAIKYNKKPKTPVDPHAEFEKKKAAVNAPAPINEHGKASRKLCTSTKPDSELGASALSSCISQGLRARHTDKKFTINKKRQKVKGKKVKGGNYGGPLPVWKGNQ